MKYGKIDLIPINIPFTGIVQRIEQASESNYFLLTIYFINNKDVKKLNRYNDKDYADDEEVFFTYTIQLLASKKEIKNFKIKVGHIIEFEKQTNAIFIKIKKVIFNG